MEEAWQILEFLPKSYKSETEQKYISFLWDSFQTNYENEKYQFAFLAFHMLFMSFVYSIIWQIKNNQPNDFFKALVGYTKEVEKLFINATSPFSFSEVGESRIFRFFKLIECDNNNIGNYTKLVKERNGIAHSNGNIFFNDQESIDAKINEILNITNEIHQFSKCLILDSFKKFLIENNEPENWEYSEPQDQIQQGFRLLH